MGGSYSGSAPSYGQNIQSIMSQYLQYLPQIAQVTSGAQPGIDVNVARGAAAAAPIYNQAALDNYQRFAPGMAQVGQQIGASNAAAGARTAADVLGGPGQQSTAAATALENQANPEQAAIRTQTANSLSSLLNSINLNGLSGSERSEVERSLGQSNTATGNLGLDNATNAVGNAMTFGSAMQTKRDALGAAINSATQFLPASRANFDPVSLALGGNPSTTTATQNAASQFQGVVPSGNQAFSTGTATQNNLTNVGAANMGMQFAQHQGDSFGGILGSQTSAIGNICCFIFLEVYNGELPWWVRKCRDHYYNQFPQIARGYKRMAKWLVPLMRWVPGVSFVVNRWMVQPLTMYGGWVKRVSGYENCRIFKCYRNFWFGIWNWMGR